jgi:arginyl-tRNA synthetase
VYNVIDSRQSYLQQLLKQALSTMGFKEQADRSTHFSYDMVALSHATARALGYEEAASQEKAFVEVSGRKGLGVKADDLLDRLIDTAGREVGARNPELAPDSHELLFWAGLAVAAVRYFLIKFSRGKVIAFDIEALSFEGETGPCTQYAAVRAANILAKLEEREGVTEEAVAGKLLSFPPSALTAGDEGDEFWGLVLEAARLDEIADSSIDRSIWPSSRKSRVRPGAGLQRLLSPSADPQRGARRRAPLARRRRLVPPARLTLALDLMGYKVPARM